MTNKELIVLIIIAITSSDEGDNGDDYNDKVKTHKTLKLTHNQSIDGVLNVVGEARQFSRVCVFCKSVVIQLAEHMSEVCR